MNLQKKSYRIFIYYEDKRLIIFNNLRPALFRRLLQIPLRFPIYFFFGSLLDTFSFLLFLFFVLWFSHLPQLVDRERFGLRPIKFGISNQLTMSNLVFIGVSSICTNLYILDDTFVHVS